MFCSVLRHIEPCIYLTCTVFPIEKDTTSEDFICWASKVGGPDEYCSALGVCQGFIELLPCWCVQRED